MSFEEHDEEQYEPGMGGTLPAVGRAMLSEFWQRILERNGLARAIDPRLRALAAWRLSAKSNLRFNPDERFPGPFTVAFAGLFSFAALAYLCVSIQIPQFVEQARRQQMLRRPLTPVVVEDALELDFFAPNLDLDAAVEADRLRRLQLNPDPPASPELEGAGEP